MRKYQKDGYKWLRTLEAWKFGGILADDMGLGKTLQVIAVMLAAREEGKNEGKIEGKTEMILAMLNDVGSIPKGLEKRILRENDE